MKVTSAVVIASVLLGSVPISAKWMESEANGDEVIVGARSRDSQGERNGASGANGEGPSPNGQSTSGYRCPTMVWVYGRYSVEAQNCNNELPTDWVPLLEWQEDMEADDAAEPSTPITVTREDVQSLLVDAGGLEVQPDRSWVLVHTETIAFTGAEQQVLTTTVLDAPIEVMVTPEQFIWDFGDGSAPLVTTDPGAPWPDHTVAHAYGSAQTAAAISVHTEWDAVFRIAGMTTWLPVAGAVVTTESSEPFEVVTATPRLIAGDS